MKSILLVVLLLGCFADPHDYTLSPDPERWAEDQALKAAVDKLPQEEKEVLAAYMARRMLAGAFGGEGIPPLGVSLGDAIEEQEAWTAEQERKAAEAAALAERVKAERAAKQKAMLDAMTVAVTEMKLRPKNFRAGRYQDSIAFTVAFENKADKPVSGSKGILHFADMFGDTIKSVNVSRDDGIQPESTAIWKAEMKYNQFIDADVKLANTPLEKLKITWEPVVIMYADGSSLPAEP